MFVCIVPNCSALIFSLFRRQRQENYRFTVHTGTYMYVPVPAFLFMGLSAHFALPACRLMCYSVYICTLVLLLATHVGIFHNGLLLCSWCLAMRFRNQYVSCPALYYPST